MLIKVLNEESDSPIVVSGDGQKLLIPREEENSEKVFINGSWRIVGNWADEPDGGVQYNLPLAPGEYGKEEIRVACVMYLRFILNEAGIEPEGDDDKYIIYEITADTDKKTIEFEIEVLDDDSEIEFNFDEEHKTNISNLINYEQNRIIKTKD